MTQLPFVYAFWAGRPGAASAEDVAGLREVRDRGVAAVDAIAAQLFPGRPDRGARAGSYLRENVKYDLGEKEEAGLRRFYELAARIGVARAALPPRFYGSR
jgi:predicted solute-binding protein